LRGIPHIFLIFSCIIFFGCKKDHSVLGVDVQPESDGLSAVFSDTCRVSAYTVKYDSIPSFNERYRFLGSNQDPVFGRTDVGLYLNSSIPNGITNVNFGDNATLVSSEIILALSGVEYVGTGTTSLTYSVFPVTTTLDRAKVYYTNNSSLHTATAALGSFTGTFSLLNGKLVLRIPMDNAYAGAVLSNTLLLENNSVYQNNYKGFYVTAEGSFLNPSTSQGNIAKFDLDDAVSGFYLYYHNGVPTESKEYRFSFSGSDAVRFNTVKYQPLSGGHALLTKQILEKDTVSAPKQNLFLKGLGGTKLKVFLPGLKNFADSSPVAVNRAEIVFNLDPSFVSSGGLYTAPPRAALLPIEPDGRETYAQDQLTDADLARYGGYYDYTNNRYVFNIARHVQAILRGTKKNYGFYLVVADPSPLVTARRDNFAERIVLAGTAHSTLKPKFSLSYIKYAHDKP
jgi:hypothetical protein